VTVRDLRRRLRHALASHDWFEGWSTAIGAVFLVLGSMSSLALVVALSSVGDPAPGFEASQGWLDATRGFGVALFGVFAVLALAVGWFLAGPAVRRAAKRLSRRG